jgi:uncharacterized RDD family membrane protein YckC
MATIAITTTQNISLEYTLASIGDRIVATLVDLGIFLAYFFVAAMFISFVGDSLGTTSSWIFISFFLPIAFYSLLSEIFFNGQTVGKRVMGIKVISLNGNQPSFGQYLARWLFRLIDLWSFSFVVGTITIAVTEKHQRVGDLVAGTTLVKLKPKTAIQETIFTAVAPENYIARYPEVVHLKDGDMQLVKEVLNNVAKTGNTMLALQTKEKIEQVLGIMSQQPDAIDFLHTILADYNHLTAQL